MDNHALDNIPDDTVEVDGSTVNTTTHSMNLMQEKSEQVFPQEENGHMTLSACPPDSYEGSGELACIDIMLPTLEPPAQDEHERNNDNSKETFENTKNNDCQYEENQNYQNNSEKLPNKLETAEVNESQNKIVELSNVHVINEVVEEEAHNQSQDLELIENQVMEVHEDQVIESIETLDFETNNIGNESMGNDDENLTSHAVDGLEEAALEEEEEEVGECEEGEALVLEEEQKEVVAMNEMEEGVHGVSEPQEYSNVKIAIDSNEQDENIHKETISDYVTENYVINKNEESLEETSNFTSDLNNEYEQLTSKTEIQVSNETVEEIPTAEHNSLESNLSSASQGTYEVFSSCRDSGETAEVNSEEKASPQLVTAAYRQKNIINIAAASANIDIQYDGSESGEIVEIQEEKQISENEVESSPAEESVNILENSGHVGSNEMLDNHQRELLIIQKEEESTSEVIEEIYFIQDVSSCSSNNYEQHKATSNVMEDVEEDRKEQEYEADYSRVGKNNVKMCAISEKSRNVIQDIFDDWGDENAEEDNQMFSNKVQDSVEIELNNLLNDNKKKQSLGKEIQHSENRKLVGGYSTLAEDIKNPVETQTISINDSMSPSASSSSSSNTFLSNKKLVKKSVVKDVPNYVQPYVRGTYTSPLSSTSLHQDQEDIGGSNSKKKMQSPRLGVKVPSRHLKSQIATPAEVTEVLKERLREKQKNLESPQAADIVFVKKLTQRFASKICSGGTMPVPGLIPLSQPSRGNDHLERNTNTTHSNDSPDNRELLAILEGDVDPDWSNLKSQSITSTDENSSGDTESSSSNNLLSKLNPAEERELALKQLLEMPTSGNKRTKKKSLKETMNKHESVAQSPLLTGDSEKEVVVEKPKEDNSNKQVETVKQRKSSSMLLAAAAPSPPPVAAATTAASPVRKPLKENGSENTPSITMQTEFRRIDETRSGRKRKPTEKALEQYASKRQKMYKTKSPMKAKADCEIKTGKSFREGSPKDKLIKNPNEFSASADSMSVSPSKQSLSKDENVTEESTSITSPSQPVKVSKYDKLSPDKKLSGLVKKKETDSPAPSSFETRKKSTINAAKRIISQRGLPFKKKPTTVNLQNKMSTSSVVTIKRPVGRPAKVNISKSPSFASLRTESKPHKKNESEKPKRKRKTGIKELDRLLQDEGVVNLLYDVGQPRKRRLIPITKSQKKVMDIEKAERDLDLRKKLVKSTVLGLRDADIAADKIAYRTKRRISLLDHSNAQSGDSSVTTDRRKSSTEMPTEFIYPAKIRNAADASVIVRRHSSSSFSSVSGSPRVSLDSPLEGGVVGGQSNDETNHGLRSTAKRKLSMVAVDKNTKHNILEARRNKQHKTSENPERVSSSGNSPKSSKVEDTKTVVTDVNKEKISGLKKQHKTEISGEKTSLGLESKGGSDTASKLENITKVTTRSNGNAGQKTLTNNEKNKRVIKDKNYSSTSTSSNKAMDEIDDESSKSQDELSACLAEAATALSSVSSSAQAQSSIIRRSSVGGSTTVGRKNKGNLSDTKKPHDDSVTNSSNVTKSKALNSSLFSDNKEIKVCRYGNLVHLILSPSSAKIANGITLKVMQEMCDTLTILKTDKECRVVLLTSSGSSSFCEGLDLSTLLHADKQKRKIYAEKMANAVKEFIKCLATFNKPLVAGVQAAAVGLGVTILPLFDLVIASDKATFYTPYGKLGQIPEGAAIMTLSHVHGSAVASELLLGGRTLTASEALRAGLVTRVLWPERFPLELIPSVKVMSEQSSQSMEATKALLRQSLRNKLDAALESETHILVKQWCSDECQEAIKTYILKKSE